VDDENVQSTRQSLAREWHHRHPRSVRLTVNKGWLFEVEGSSACRFEKKQGKKT
jgi:hypothetical protein